MSARRVAGLLLALTVLSGCDTSNYAFKVDNSIRIVEPAARTTVPLPVQLRWTDSRPPPNLKMAPDDPTASYYAVFLDAAPMAPGDRLESLVPGDTPCKLSDGCPTGSQLSDAGAYLTARPSLRLDFVADLRPTSRGNTKDTHEVTIVRMRGDKRVGEAAFRQTFFVRR